jgi:hypothetical protein
MAGGKSPTKNVLKVFARKKKYLASIEPLVFVCFSLNSREKMITWQ